MSRAALSLARLELRLTLADRSAALWMFIMPVVFATFFGMVMGGGQDPTATQVKLTVVDEDGGELYVYRPPREQPLERILTWAKEGATGPDRGMGQPEGVGLVSAGFRSQPDRRPGDRAAGSQHSH